MILRPLRLHGSPHSSTAWALRLGKSIRWMADVAGHQDPALTLRACAHAMREAETDLAFAEAEREASTASGPTEPNVSVRHRGLEPVTVTFSRITRAQGCASSRGVAALDVLRREPVEMILLDIKMPGKDGMSLLKEVKEKWPNIPVIVMSGYATTETVEQVSRTEAATFIAKPFTPDELVEVVAKVIGKEGKP